MTPEEKAELRRLCEAATPEPWELDGWSDSDDHISICHNPSDVGGITTAAWIGDIDDGGGDITDEVEANAKLIAAARNSLPGLLDENGKLRTELEQLRAERDQARAACAAIRDFVATEMDWQWFRAEMMEHDFAETGVTAKNAKALQEYLRTFSPETSGQALLDRMERLEEALREVVEDGLQTNVKAWQTRAAAALAGEGFASIGSLPRCCLFCGKRSDTSPCDKCKALAGEEKA